MLKEILYINSRTLGDVSCGSFCKRSHFGCDSFFCGFLLLFSVFLIVVVDVREMRRRIFEPSKKTPNRREERKIIVNLHSLTRLHFALSYCALLID